MFLALLACLLTVIGLINPANGCVALEANKRLTLFIMFVSILDHVRLFASFAVTSYN